MRVLVAAPGAFGHVHPMLPLVRALARRGDDVRWVTSPSLCEHLAAEGFDADPAGIEVEERQERFRQLHPEQAELPVLERRMLMFRSIFGEISAPAMLPGLRASADRFRPDVLVHDAAELASPLVAAERGIPQVTHGFGALLPPPLVESAGTMTAPLWVDAGIEPRRFAGCYDDGLYVDIYPAMLQPFSLDHIPRVQALRPAIDDTEATPVPARVAVLEPPLIYATFGTVFAEPAVFRPVIDAAREIDARFVVTVGPSGDPDALGPVPSNVVVERYVPQAALLDRCALVVSHAGSGTFLGTIARGIPQVCIPQAADQFVNADGCARVGAGIAISPDGYDAGAVAGAITQLLHDDAARTAARAVADAIGAMPLPDEVAEVVERLAA